MANSATARRARRELHPLATAGPLDPPATVLFHQRGVKKTARTPATGLKYPCGAGDRQPPSRLPRRAGRRTVRPLALPLPALAVCLLPPFPALRALIFMLWCCSG